jgi:hypothetical protein
MMRRLVCAAGMIVVTAARPAFGQEGMPTGTRHVGVDTVIGYQDYVGDYEDWPAQFVADTFMTAEVRPRWQVSFRPKVWRVRGDWETLVDQLSVETEFHRGSNWRVEAGRFPSPIGLGMTENRADLNAGMIWWHRAYYMPLPSLGADVPRVSLMSAVYPVGGQVSTSASHWDARAAIVDRAPVQFWHAPAGATRGANGIVGGGVTPWQGFRIGLASAWGRYADPTTSRAGLAYAGANLEGEYAFGYTKISGEWIRDRFETATGHEISRGWTIQAQQTLTPRLFVHTRLSAIASPEASKTMPGESALRRYRAIDTTVGYRVSPTLTIRLGHTATHAFTGDDVDQQIGVSLMWANRWW